MSSAFTRVRIRRAWWWVFAILVAAPALVLSVLGLRATRADRFEQEHRLREQLAQTARLADSALANAVERTAARLDRVEIEAFAKATESSLNNPEPDVFLFEANGVVTFPARRIYFGPTGQKTLFLVP